MPEQFILVQNILTFSDTENLTDINACLKILTDTSRFTDNDTGSWWWCCISKFNSIWIILETVYQQGISWTPLLLVLVWTPLSWVLVEHWTRTPLFLPSLVAQNILSLLQWQVLHSDNLYQQHTILYCCIGGVICSLEHCSKFCQVFCPGISCQG